MMSGYSATYGEAGFRAVWRQPFDDVYIKLWFPLSMIEIHSLVTANLSNSGS